MSLQRQPVVLPMPERTVPDHDGYRRDGAEPNISAVAALMADPARACMLAAVLDGRALPAGELAHAAGITAQTASSHLAKLLDGGLFAVEREGRHRYYRLAGAHVADVIERLATIRPAGPVRRKALSANARELRFARRCYDHLAGEMGVALTRVLVQREYLMAAADKQFAVTQAGAAWFASLGIDITALKPSRRGFARQCLDWTEREHHLAGPLGVALMEILCTAGWLRRAKQSRAMLVTPKGRFEFKRQLGLDLSSGNGCLGG